MAKFYGVNMRHIVGSVIDTEFDELKDYVETVEGAVKGKFETFKARAERRAEGTLAKVPDDLLRRSKVE